MNDSSDKPETGGGAATEGESIQTRFAGRTAVGLVREHNEDNFVIVDLTKQERCPRDEVDEREVGERGMLFSVCDGMGGAAAGEVASQMAVDILFDAMTRDPAPQDRDDLARRLVGAIEEAGKRIHDAAQAERERRGMGTTSTAAALLDKVLFVGEVGDSRAYLLRGGVMKQITKDQSLVSQLIEAGHLTEDEAEAFEHSNIILQALGTSETVQVDLTFVELRRGDRVMLCSDGLSGLVHDDSIKEALSDIEDPSECAATLIEYAEAGGGHDNITVIVADFDGEGLPEAADSDSFGYMQYPLLPEGAVGAQTVKPEAPGDSGKPTPPRDVEDDVPEPPTHSGGRGWLIAGLIAILVGGYVLTQSTQHRQAQGDSGTQDPQPPAAGQEDGTETPEVEPVEVRIHTDVEGATLLVNGEAHGRLLVDTAKQMKLPPGAYRFEASLGEQSPAVRTLNLSADGTPTEVYLYLPDGKQPTDAATAEPAEEGDVEAAEEAESEGAKAETGDDGAEDPAEAEARRERRRARREARKERERAAAAEAAPSEPVEKAEPTGGLPKPKPKPVPKPKAEGTAPLPDNPF